ncbi:MAG: hypothetical protein EOO75_02405 [Myxococcales bacterium]|nr:MAG: hypothetical protein EOO75_02405 [Myxococcales bacterium]
MLAVSLSLAAGPARAQGAPAAGSAEPTKPNGGTISDEARRNFRVGVALLEDPDGARYEEAYTAFKAAYVASMSPKILGNLALCAMKIERDNEAIEAYSRYLREAPGITPVERVQIERDLTQLRANLATVSLTVNAARFTVLDRRTRPGAPPIVNTYEGAGNKLDLGLRPGHHELHVRAEGMAEQVFEIELPVSARESRTIELKSAAPALAPVVPEARPRPSLTGPLVVSGAAVALLAAGAVTGIVAVNKTGDIQDQCPRNRCPAGYDLDGARSSARRFVRVTDGLLLGGAVVGVAGVTWLALKLTGSGSAAPAPQTSRFDGGAMCTHQGCAGEVKVSF